jgi:hypothetical protein
MRVCRVTELDQRAWVDALEAAHRYSFFVTPRYLRTWAHHFADDAPTRAIKIVAPAGLGWRLIAFVDLPSSRRLRTRRLVAAPEGGYGVAGVGAMPENWLQDVLQQLTTLRNESVEITTSPVLWDESTMTNAIARDDQEAWVIDLGLGADAWIASLDKRVRRQLRISEERGVHTQRSTVDDLDVFYQLYRGAVDNDPERNVLYSKSFLADLMRESGPGDAALYLARFQGEIIAGGFLLHGKAEALAWIGAMDRRFGALHANVNRHVAVARDLVDAGVTAYNLGAAPGLPEVAEFKRRLGATAQPYATLVAYNPLWTRLRRWSARLS